MTQSKKWVLWSRMALAVAILSFNALVSYAQCLSPNTPINFSTSGNTTTAGYTTTYVLTDNSGKIIQTVVSGFAAPGNTGTYRVYAVNYNTASGNTAPTLTAGTNLTAIGGSCVAISSSPIEFCVTATCVAPGSSLMFTAIGQNRTTGFTTVYVLTTSAGNIISTTTTTPPNSTSPVVTAPVTGGMYKIYAVNYNTATGNTAPTFTAGTNITAIGGTCVATASPYVFDVCPSADLTPIVYALPSTQYGTTNFTVVVDVYDLNSTASNGPITVYITKDPLVNLSFSGNSVFVGGKIVQNGIWTLDNTDDDFYIFTTTEVITGKGHKSIGLTGVLTPGNTKGTATISTTILGGSGGEVKIDNNSDADKIDYFKK